MPTVAQSDIVRGGWSRTIRRIIAVVVSLLAAILLVEVLLRITPIGPRAYQPRRFEPRGVPFAQASSGSISFPVYQPSVEFSSIYDPAGDSRGYLGPGGRVTYRINSHGFRGPEIGVARPKGCYRVLCLGDSLTFGEGVHGDDAYPNRMEKILRARSPSRNVQVINAGVQAHGTKEEVALFFLRGMAFKPDVVTLGFFLNDAMPFAETIRQNDAATKELPLSAPARISRIWETLERRGRRTERQTEFFRAVRESFQGEDWAICKELLRTMRDQAKASGFRFIVLILPVLWGLDGDYPFEEIHAQIASACGEIGCECIDILPVFRGRAAESLWVHPTDQHPNEIAQRLIAEKLADAIEVP